MRLAFYTYSYTDRLKMEISACLERISKTGYSGIDVSGTNGKSSDPNSFDQQRRSLTRKTAEKLSLKLEAVITHAQLTDTLSNPNRNRLDLKGSVDLAADIGADVVTFHMGGYHESVAKNTLWRQVVDVIRAAADYGAARHVRLAVDGIWPTWIDDSPATLNKLFDDVDHMNFGVNFDPCYLTLMGIDPVRFAKQFRTRIFHGHLKDHKGKYPKWTHLIPGQGEMNYGPVFRSLAEIKFDAAVAVECFTDMKFESACDDGFSAMTKAAQNAHVTFKK
jgi:sugar phosphate isomerase/epimerase